MTVYRFAHALSTIIARTYFSFRVIHRERVIEEGPAVLAMNHQSFLDPPLAGICCKRDIYFLARKSLLQWPILGPIFPKLNVVPVDQTRPDMSALKAVIRLVRSGHCTIIFPEGGRTFDGKLQPAQPGLGLVIAKTFAPVVPMRVFGAYEAYPRGSKFPRPHPITIVVGEPIFFSKDDVVEAGRDAYQKLSERVMERITQLELQIE
jgi:1-acyl-sn-glycerol-3-phosphate acyltransferase